ncbi:hypothetical protein C8R45DRAFT_547706 [Mycena sanguinolenta]|nr:hypothetical protein C8R45DRAFT_547706 [Mycena sanguinolenta]
MNCQFSFGPNRSYFCSAGSVYAWSEKALPPALSRLLEDNAHPQAIDTPYDVAFPPQPGTYALCWKTKSGKDWYEDGRLGPHYARLARFIKNVATNGGYTTRTVFGPNGSFFSMSPSGFCWQNLPPELEDDIHRCIKIRRPTSVALGAQGSYIVLYNDGTVVFDLRGQYPLVESMIRNTQDAARRRGVMYIALNPFIAGEYYAVYGDGSAAWNFPTAWSADVIAVSRQIQAMPMPMPVPAPAPQPQPSVPPPAPVVEVSLGGTGPSLPAPALPQPSPALPQPSPALPQPSPALPQPSPALPQPSPALPQPSPAPAPTTSSVPMTLTTTGGTTSSASPAPAPIPTSAPVAPTPTGSTISGGTISGGSPAPILTSSPVTSSPVMPTPTGSSISGGTISGGTISGGRISGATMSGGTVSGGTVSGGTVSGGTTGSAMSGGTTSGGSISGIASAVEQAFDAATQPPPPAYAPTAGGTFSGGTFAAAPAPVPVVPQASSPLPTPPAQAPAHKMTWQEGLSMGIKAAKGINKLANAFQNPTQALQQQQQQATQNFQQATQNFQQATQGFDLSNLVANLPDLSNLQQQQQQGSVPVFDQLVVQETIFDNGNTVVDTTVVDAITWQNAGNF